MKLQKVPVEKPKPAKYNPGKDLKPDDPAYEKIKYNMTTYGYIDPLIWNNEITDTIVDDYQQYKVLVAEGVKEIDCVVVHIESLQDEKALDIAFNKAFGEWVLATLYAMLLASVATDCFPVHRDHAALWTLLSQSVIQAFCNL